MKNWVPKSKELENKRVSELYAAEAAFFGFILDNLLDIIRGGHWGGRDMSQTKVVQLGRNRRKKRISSMLQSVFFICLLALGFFVFLHSSIFAVSEVIVTGVSHLKVEDVRKLSGIQKGENIFKVKVKEAEDNIRLHPIVKNVVGERRLPDQIHFEVVERTPRVLIPRESAFIALDNESVFIYTVKDINQINLPIVTGTKISGTPQPGDIIKDKGLKSALAFVDALPVSFLNQLSEVNAADPYNIIFYTIGGVEIRAGEAKAIDNKVKLLQETLSGQNLDEIEYIDISVGRNQVIKLKENNADMEGEE